MMLEVRASQLKERLRAKITRTKTTVLAIFFRVPVPSVSLFCALPPLGKFFT
jgi:hypothetical protein